MTPSSSISTRGRTRPPTTPAIRCTGRRLWDAPTRPCAPAACWPSGPRSWTAPSSAGWRPPNSRCGPTAPAGAAPTSSTPPLLADGQLVGVGEVLREVGGAGGLVEDVFGLE